MKVKVEQLHFAYPIGFRIGISSSNQEAYADFFQEDNPKKIAKDLYDGAVAISKAFDFDLQMQIDHDELQKRENAKAAIMIAYNQRLIGLIDESEFAIELTKNLRKLHPDF